MVPGTLFVLVVNQALLTGWQAGVWIITGHAVAELLLLLALRVGLGRVLQRRAVTRVIGLVGGREANSFISSSVWYASW